MMEIFGEYCQQLLAINYFRKKTPSLMLWQSPKYNSNVFWGIKKRHEFFFKKQPPEVFYVFLEI